MHLKKTVAWLLAAAIGLSMFSGCQGKEPAQQKQLAGASAAEASGTEPNSMPIVKQPMTFRMFCYPPSSPWAKTRGDMPPTQEMEKRTGIRIEWLHPAQGQWNEQFNLMIASGDLPEMISQTWATVAGGPQKYFDDGVVIDLKDAINKWGPNLKKTLDKYPVVRKSITLDGGQLYMAPFVQKPEPIQVIYGGFMLRKDWMDKLGLQIPKTVDDWYNVLKAFKTKDPNGNGKDDEIPMINANGTGSGQWTTLNAWLGAWGLSGGFIQKNGKIVYSPIDPGYKHWLSTMNKWYSEGLIDPAYVSSDMKAMDAMVLNNRAGAFAELAGRGMEKYLRLSKDKIPGFDLVATPWPIGPGGKEYAVYVDMTAMDGHKGTVVTSAGKKNLKEITKWLDYWYSEEGLELTNFGVKGVSYDVVNGKPKYSDEVMKNPKGVSVDQATSHYRMVYDDLMGVDLWDAIEPTYTFKQNKEAVNIWFKGSYDILLPVLLWKGDEGQRLSKIMNEINTYQAERRDKIIMGQESVDSYDKAVDQMKKMGIDEAIKIYQAALDRHYAKK